MESGGSEKGWDSMERMAPGEGVRRRRAGRGKEAWSVIGEWERRPSGSERGPGQGRCRVAHTQARHRMRMHSLTGVCACREGKGKGTPEGLLVLLPRAREGECWARAQTGVAGSVCGQAGREPG